MAGDGVILVHGGLHTSRCWEYLLPLLDVPARAVDLPGRGSRPADLSRVALADCVAAVIDEADEAKFTSFALVGHSLGGVTITETAYLHATRVSRLVYVGALVPPPGSSSSILMTGGQLEAMTPMAEETAKTLFGNDLTEEQWAHHFEGIVPDAVGIMNAQLSGYPTGIPITYVNMSADVPVPPALADQMAGNLGPRVERRTIEAGHTVMVSQPKKLAAIINEVVAR
jgi:pimeloyl-ACP methyl ester carboxylesterase